MRIRQVITNGRVLCLRDGRDVDVDVCVGCPHFRGVRVGGNRSAVLDCDQRMDAYVSYAGR